MGTARRRSRQRHLPRLLRRYRRNPVNLGQPLQAPTARTWRRRLFDWLRMLAPRCEGSPALRPKTRQSCERVNRLCVPRRAVSGAPFPVDCRRIMSGRILHEDRTAIAGSSPRTPPRAAVMSGPDHTRSAEKARPELASRVRGCRRSAALPAFWGRSSARFEMMSERLSDDLGDRNSFFFCPACEALLEFWVEPDGFDR